MLFRSAETASMHQELAAARQQFAAESEGTRASLKEQCELLDAREDGDARGGPTATRRCSTCGGRRGKTRTVAAMQAFPGRFLARGGAARRGGARGGDG